jgi:hypothetical protein
VTPYTPLALAWIVLAILLPGHLLLGTLGPASDRRLAPNEDRIAWLSWCAATGAVLNCLLLFGWLWAFPGTLSPLGLGCVQVLFALALWRLRARANPTPAPDAAAVVSRFAMASALERGVFWGALVLALALVVTRILGANMEAALTGDGALLWTFKARVIHASGGLGDTYVEAMRDPRLRHEDYPLFNPLLQAWMFQLKGASAFVAQRFPIQLLGLALILGLAAALRRIARPAIAALLLIIFVASPATKHAVSFAAGDAMVALGALLATDAWLRWRQDGRAALLGVMAISIALMIGSKAESSLFLLGLAAGLLLVALVGRFRAPSNSGPKTPRRQLLIFLLPLVTLIAGAAFNIQAGFQNDLAAGKAASAGFATRFANQWQDYFSTVWSYFWSEAWLMPYYDGLVFACLTVATALSVRTLFGGCLEARDLLLPISITAIFWCGLFLVYLATPQPLVWHLESSALRVLWQALPIATIALAGLLDNAQRTGDRTTS